MPLYSSVSNFRLCNFPCFSCHFVPMSCLHYVTAHSCTMLSFSFTANNFRWGSELQRNCKAHARSKKRCRGWSSIHFVCFRVFVYMLFLLGLYLHLNGFVARLEFALLFSIYYRIYCALFASYFVFIVIVIRIVGWLCVLLWMQSHYFFKPMCT